MNQSPSLLFKKWYEEAQRHPDIKDASAMALATADKNGRPGVRMVLLKRHDARGLVFFTNLGSPKARDLTLNAQAALCFHWPALGRQLRVEGTVVPVEDSEADIYFETRPRLSQLGAWASRQSQPMGTRLSLSARVAVTAARFGLGRVPRPEHWSGFRVQPTRMEFWSEGPYRTHERLLFERTDSEWVQSLLYP